MRLAGYVALAVAVAHAGFGAATRAQPAAIAVQEFTVPSPQPGLDIYVRNKHPADAAAFGPARTLVFVHGATY
ncbi:MAG: alpha/beta hydrolase, partial [Alphaproteobacteria bacterium]|nr:alpha/beta hydrolase [Alphaproteobacteria bacterium]